MYNPATFDEAEFAKALGRLTDERLDQMATASLLLAAKRPERVTTEALSEEARTEFLRSVEQILTDISLDQDVRETDKLHLLKLIGDLEDALRTTDSLGTRPVEVAVKLIVADAQLNKDLWDRVASRKWVKRVGIIVSGLLLVLGGYSDGKELVGDVWPTTPAIATTQHSEPEHVTTSREIVPAEDDH